MEIKIYTYNINMQDGNIIYLWSHQSLVKRKKK